ncbi:MAG: hypothetical protein ABIP20_11015 [Chthoniobacteraceae bacterium]
MDLMRLFNSTKRRTPQFLQILQRLCFGDLLPLRCRERVAILLRAAGVVALLDHRGGVDVAICVAGDQGVRIVRGFLDVEIDLNGESAGECQEFEVADAPAADLDCQRRLSVRLGLFEVHFQQREVRVQTRESFHHR